MLLSDGFLNSARKRLVGPELTEGDLRRAASDLYFAMFHAICETMANIVVGDEQLALTKEAWSRLYRLPDHSHVSKACDDGRIQELSPEIQSFASQFKAMQVLREDADYDALKQFEASQVRRMLELVEAAMAAFRSADVNQRLRFAVFAAVKRR